MSNNAVLVETQDQFQSIVDAVIETGLPVIALFSATSWCIPCQRFEPHWAKAQEQLSEYTFVKVDMGATPEDTGQHWATTLFGVRGVPTVKLFDGDSVRDITARAVVPFVREVQSHG